MAKMYNDHTRTFTDGFHESMETNDINTAVKIMEDIYCNVAWSLYTEIEIKKQNNKAEDNNNPCWNKACTEFKQGKNSR